MTLVETYLPILLLDPELAAVKDDPVELLCLLVCFVSFDLPHFLAFIFLDKPEIDEDSDADTSDVKPSAKSVAPQSTKALFDDDDDDDDEDDDSASRKRGEFNND